MYACCGGSVGLCKGLWVAWWSLLQGSRNGTCFISDDTMYSICPPRRAPGTTESSDRWLHIRVHHPSPPSRYERCKELLPRSARALVTPSYLALTGAWTTTCLDCKGSSATQCARLYHSPWWRMSATKCHQRSQIICNTVKPSCYSEILILKHALVIIWETDSEIIWSDWELKLNPGDVTYCCQVVCTMTLPAYH